MCQTTDGHHITVVVNGKENGVDPEPEMFKDNADWVKVPGTIQGKVSARQMWVIKSSTNLLVQQRLCALALLLSRL